MKNFYYFLLLILALVNPFNGLQAQCNGVSKPDSLKLMNLYYTLGGDDWTDNSGWLVEPVKEWYGVTLSEDECRVIELNLEFNGLNGNLSELNLLKLKHLNLSHNNLFGYIPQLNLPELEYLNLNRNRLGGSLPNFSNLPKLKYLDLFWNLLSGEIPDFSSVPNLEFLRLSNNQLEGQVPNFSKISKLEFLNLAYNKLTEDVPNFSNFPNLIELFLYGNRFYSKIPNFSNFPKLETLSLSKNSLTGEISNFNLPSLKILNLSENPLIGAIPDFSNMPKLEELNLDNNALSGSIPDFSNFPNLVKLKLRYNRLSGYIPDFSNLRNLRTIHLRNNRLSGVIPNFSSLDNVISIDLRNNKLTGYIPNFSNLSNLSSVDVCPNNLIGPVPNFGVNIYDKSCLEVIGIVGIAYHDLNFNCSQDDDEPILSGIKISTIDDSFSTFTDEHGFYSLALDIGTHQITATPPNFLWSEGCPNSYTVTFENYTDSIPDQNFGFTTEDECTLLTIDVASPLQRRCFKNTYTVSYCNEGTRTADNPFIELTFPDELIPLDASIPYSQDGNVFTFDLEALAIGGCGSFTVVDSVSCEAVLGSAACVEGRIYPAFLCRETSSLWDGSDLVLEGECVDDEYIEFSITNIGEDMQESIEYRIYEDDVFSSSNQLQLMKGESQEVSIAATGKTYRLKASQTAFHPLESELQAVVELCGGAPYSLGFVTSQANSDLEHFIDIDCQEIIGSFDPNDKTVHPTGIAAQHYIEEGTELTYKIRFQNTGNDTAFRVTIIDTLQSEFLDPQTFKITNTSHPYDVRITDRNVLIVEFNNILLPDSTTNEPESHGFVQYRIMPFQDAPKKSIITNFGDIYFDYNHPITTNTVFNTIGIPELDVTLPIELLQFDAYLDKHQNAQLTWITASEINNSYFEIQKSSDGKYFEAIGKVEGKGTSSELHFYRFEDSNLSTNTSTVYFRLKQIDFNGQFVFSKIISLSLQNEHRAKIFYNSIQNTMEVIAASSLQLQVFDAVGRLVKSVEIIEGKQIVDLQGLESGIYTYRLLQSGLLKIEEKGKILVVRD